MGSGAPAADCIGAPDAAPGAKWTWIKPTRKENIHAPRMPLDTNHAKANESEHNPRIPQQLPSYNPMLDRVFSDDINDSAKKAEDTPHLAVA
eukprot:7379260-Prorocentrum_lima.AAC.1